MKRLAATLAAVLLVGAISFVWLSAPTTIDANTLPAHQADLANGETLFWAGGCASCHAAENASGDEKLVLSGGYQIATPFGIFVAPNISPHTNGIAGWSNADFINAMVHGVSPAGEHYYPAFPYNYYQQMTITDLLDLKAYLDTLPASDVVSQNHQISFPISFRRGLGLWKRLYLNGEPFQPIKDTSFEINRGKYLVDAVAHCGACHTPRDQLGGEQTAQYLQGATLYEIPSSDSQSIENTAENLPAGLSKTLIETWAPNITSSNDGLVAWSAEDIAYSLETGFTPEFDSFGGSMASVQANTAKLSAEDRLAISRYLKTLE